ncbi:MAG: DUF4912 domain-containing protein [Nitrospiraceae bacterium]|nr:DUF4912 domain-containing protein [Nitrospiraceae bacterium]
MANSSLQLKTVAELKAMAKKKKITVPAGSTKTDLIGLLSKSNGAKPAKTAAKAKVKAAKSAKPAASKAKTAPAKKAVKKKAAAAKPAARRAKPVLEAPLKAAAAKEPQRRVKIPATEPLAEQEQVSVAKFFTGSPEFAALETGASLPGEYGEERIIMLPRDPEYAFAYWEIPQERIDRERALLGHDSRLCVRVYDITGVHFDGSNATAYFDQDVYEHVGSWYFNLQRPGRSFCADIGLRTSDGRFLVLARSNAMSMPSGEVSDVLDEEWMSIEEDFVKLYGIPGWIAGGQSAQSQQVQELLRLRRLMDISSASLSGRSRKQGR